MRLTTRGIVLLACADSSADVIGGAYLSMRMEGKPPQAGTTVDASWALSVGEASVAQGFTRFYHTSPATSMDLPLGGEEAVFASGGSAAYMCQTGSGQCHVYDSQTKTTRAFTVALPTRPVSDADWAYVREKRLAGTTVAYRDKYKKVLDALPRTKTFARLETIRADANGRLWVKTYARYRQATALWLVATPAGEAVATVIMPSGLTPLAFAGTEMLGQTEDEDGALVIRRYRVPLP
jgi:hypothetical protein